MQRLIPSSLPKHSDEDCNQSSRCEAHRHVRKTVYISIQKWTHAIRRSIYRDRGVDLDAALPSKSMCAIAAGRTACRVYKRGPHLSMRGQPLRLQLSGTEGAQ